MTSTILQRTAALKIETDVVLYEELNCRLKIVGSALTSDTGVSDPDEFQHFFTALV